METLTEERKRIKGWGIDADQKNEPTYPMKNYTGDDHKRLDYERPPLQEETVEVLQSNERPSKSAVFGTSAPLEGISGFLRRLAFRYSESSFGHWFPLIFADRVNVWEGYFKDFRKGHIPNVFAERGMKAEWKYNKKQVITRVAVRAAIAGVILAWALSGTKKRKKEKIKTLARYI
jgi:hypothetical protein